MKYIDTSQSDAADMAHRVAVDQPFSFRCHPDVSCFNKCCRNLNLYLYPYDVIRLKKQLQLTSDQFIERYTDAVLRDGESFPTVLLTMADTAEKECPFLSSSGCGVYQNRPYSCRMFPMDQGVLHTAETGQTEPVYFFKPPDFCCGRHEDTKWTPLTWLVDQMPDIYAEMTRKWAKIIGLTAQHPFSDFKAAGTKRGKMAFMAVYNVDMFRSFLFSSTFFDRYTVTADVKQQIETSDTHLLQFGLDWFRFVLWQTASTLFKS